VADESAAFLLTCEVLAERTPLTPVQVRGTVRLALQEAGLFPECLTHAEMAVVARKLLARELAAGGVPDAEPLCEELARRLEAVPDEAPEDSPDAVFARLGLTV